jgi:HEPN domain
MSPAIWLAMARDDLRAAELLHEHGLPPLSRLHADQAVEKALRAFHLHRERQADEELAGAARRPPFPFPAASTVSIPEAKPPRPGGEFPVASRLGEETGWIAAALASLSLTADRRGAVTEDAELAQEAIQVAHAVLDRITERVYG